MKVLFALVFVLCLQMAMAVPTSCSDQGAVVTLGKDGFLYAPPSPKANAFCDHDFICFHSCSACPIRPITYNVKSSSMWNTATAIKWNSCKKSGSCTCKKFFVEYLGVSETYAESKIAPDCTSHCAQYPTINPQGNGRGRTRRISRSISSSSSSRTQEVESLEKKTNELEKEVSLLEAQSEDFEFH